MTNYATADDITDAICRLNATVGIDEETGTPVLQDGPIDGTYRIIPSWIGSQRVWMAERIQETAGYEVAYRSAQEGPNLIHSQDRWGAWVSGGILYLDRTAHVVGPLGVALDMARTYAQECVWSWAQSATIDATNPATAL